jgi:hypothetical protein
MLRARRVIQRSRTIGWRDLDAWITKQTPWCESLRRNVRNALSPHRGSPE